MRAISARARCTCGSQGPLSGVRNSPVRRKPKKPVQAAAHVRTLSYSNGLMARAGLILARMPLVIGRGTMAGFLTTLNATQEQLEERCVKGQGGLRGICQ